MDTGRTPNARSGRVSLGVYLTINSLLLVFVCAGSWFLAAKANQHGIPPNTSVGFRSEHSLASLRGWYVAQRVGFHFAALTSTIVTGTVFAAIAVATVRGCNRLWFLIIPVVGGLGIATCFLIAGQRADKAAISVETPKANRAMSSDCSPGCRGQQVQIRYRAMSVGIPTEDQKGEVPYL